LLKQQSMP